MQTVQPTSSFLSQLPQSLRASVASRGGIPTNVETIAGKLRDSGLRVYLCGGTVRSLCEGKQPADVDPAVDGTLDAIDAVLDASIPRRIKESFGLCVLGDEQCHVDLNILRNPKDACSSDFRKSRFISRATLSEDALLHDFSVNALYFCLDEQVIYDFHDGISDLRKRTLRLVAHTAKLSGDHTLPLRILRFAMAGYAMDPRTFSYLHARLIPALDAIEPQLLDRFLESQVHGRGLSLREFYSRAEEVAGESKKLRAAVSRLEGECR